MILINSAAYVVSEFRTEFGKIPPCLIPLGNKKLIEFQVPALRKVHTERVILSLPETYELSIDEHTLLTSLDVHPIKVPDGLSLAEALLYVLNVIDSPDVNVRMLHGDTYIEEIPEGENLIAVAASQDDYSWETESSDDESELVWCGYFSFESRYKLTRALALSNSDFVRAVRHYATAEKMERTHVKGWHDLGHVNTYFASRSKITTQRVFNSLQIADGVVRKSGENSAKISAESRWFSRLPPALRRYVPQLIETGTEPETGRPYYVLEYLPCTPLNEIFVHGRNPVFFWKRIFGTMAEFFSAARRCDEARTAEQLIRAESNELYGKKTYERLQQFSIQQNLNLDKPTCYANTPLPSLNDIVADCVQRTADLPIIPAILHGDFCLSNVLFDSRSAHIKLVDPRGMTNSGGATIYGDQKYDIAKLSHSIIGLYDYIIAGRYKLVDQDTERQAIDFILDERLKSIQALFGSTVWSQNTQAADVLPLVILLFLSMLPLHVDRPDRQQAMLLNALRLYTDLLRNVESERDLTAIRLIEPIPE